MRPNTKLPNYKLLKDAYAIIDGIPAKNLDLKTWRAKDKGPSCGTVACAAGWLTLHPKFQALGLTIGGSRSDIHTSWPIYQGKVRIDAMALLFGITWPEAHELFGPRRAQEGADLGLRPFAATDKHLFLARTRALLKKHGQLKEQLAA